MEGKYLVRLGQIPGRDDFSRINRGNLVAEPHGRKIAKEVAIDR